jgi:glutamine cyclotransferase
MSDAIPSLLAIGLFIAVVTGITATVIQVVDRSRASVTQQEIRTTQEVNTTINGPEKRIEVQASSTIELTVHNAGNTPIHEFDRWDLVLENRLSTSSTSISYLSYTTSTQPGSNEWTLLGIYNNASSTTRVLETFGPGVLDPGEAIVALLNPSPAVVPDTFDRATFVTPTGVTAKIIFKVLPVLLYVTNATDTVIYMYETDGTLYGSKNLNSDNTNAYGITTKDAKFWTTDLNDDVVYEYVSDFSFATSSAQTGPNQHGSGITTNRDNIWIVDEADDVVYKYNMVGTFINSFALTAANTDPTGIATDGTNLWIVDEADNAVYKYDMTGTFINSFALTAANTDPTGITTDGTNIWVVDEADDAVYKYDMAGTFDTSFTLTAANADPQGVTVAPR